MGIGTLLRYLSGDRRAIIEIASNRRALWVGLLFVLSAGFAREYDGEDLLREPWHLLVPLAASLVSSFVLFSICYGRVIAMDPDRPRFFAAYRSFLTLFWMTAPLAWLYAVPYERFLDPVGAVRANLWTLGVVAAWRVVLMIRVVSVLMGYRMISAVFLVMLFADVVAFLAVYLTPTPQPVFAIMGGVRHTEAERLILAFTHNLTCLGILTVPLWLIGAGAATATDTPAWQIPPHDRYRAAAPARSLWALAIASLVIWLLFLPRPQAEQRLRYDVERDLRAGRISEALTVMSAHAPSDFPPYWEPPPRVGYAERKPPLFDVLEAIAEHRPAPWVETAYLEKLGQWVSNRFMPYGLREADASRLLLLFQRLPNGRAIAAEHREDLKFMVYQDRFSREEKTMWQDLLDVDVKGNPRKPAETDGKQP
jgi:hypothetical protein